MDDPQTKLEEPEIKTKETPTVTPAADLNDTESEDEQTTSNSADDGSESPASELTGGDNLTQSKMPQICSSMNCEGLSPKIGQIVKYTDNLSVFKPILEKSSAEQERLLENTKTGTICSTVCLKKSLTH